MKKLFCLFTFLISSIAFSQNKQQDHSLHITITEKSDQPLSSRAHSYVYTLKNISRENILFTINTTAVDCNKKSSKMKVKIQTSTNQSIENIQVKAQASYSFTIKLERNHLTKLDTWSCVEINAIDRTGIPISNTVKLSQFIPDTKKFQ